MYQIKRQLSAAVEEALKTFPVVYVNGPRQSGKSTLAQHIAETSWPADYVSFDDFNLLRAAEANPESFVRTFANKLVLDEVQMVPRLFRVLKMLVDEARKNDPASSSGRYLLTGSANVLALPELSDALVGRMRVLSLYPLSAVEIAAGNGDFLNRLMNGRFHPHLNEKTWSVSKMIKHATFPQISTLGESERRQWLDSYVVTLLQRDVRQIADLSKLSILPNLLAVMAARVGGLVNEADIARSIGQNAVTTNKYRTLLQMVYLTADLKPWFRNISKRLVKSPKSYFIDTSLLCFIQNIDIDKAETFDPQKFGLVFENFVVSELLKQISFSVLPVQIYHFRTSDSKEVDLVIEQSDGKLAGVEIKSRDSVTESDFKGLKELQKHTGDDFACGIVLYRGRQLLPYGAKLWAVPVDEIWS